MTQGASRRPQSSGKGFEGWPGSDEVLKWGCFLLQAPARRDDARQKLPHRDPAATLGDLKTAGRGSEEGCLATSTHTTPAQLATIRRWESP